MLGYNTSPIDWCEGNYYYSSHIAELWNTLSSFSFVVVGFIGLRNNPREKIQIAYLLLVAIGFTSVYFHATLSLFGQLLDEASILIFIEYLVSLLTKRTWNPVLSIVSTFPLFLFPEYNAVVMLFVGVIIATYVWHNKVDRTSELDIAGFCLLVAWGFWMSDKLCTRVDVDIVNAYIRAQNGHSSNRIISNHFFLHTHFVWHIIVAVSGYYVVRHFEEIVNKDT